MPDLTLDWHDAALDAHHAWNSFVEARDPITAAYALTTLNDAMSDLATWLPGYNPETGRIETAEDDDAPPSGFIDDDRTTEP
jgi:hypothetical protein